jgi:Domain of unknown function (DUF4436)
MAHGGPATPPPMSSPAVPPTPQPTPQPRSLVLRLATAFGILSALVIMYALTLVAVHVLAKSAPGLPAVDLDKYQKEDTVVQVRLDELKPVTGRLAVSVLVNPKDSMFDERLGVLKTDAAVRLYPGNDLGDLQYPVGKAPAQVGTTVEATGDPGNWPFDSYTTPVLSAVVLTGPKEARELDYARVEITGKLEGWDATVTRVHDPGDKDDPNSLDDVIVTLHRSKGPLIFDLGICLVLITLPTLALWVAIPMALGRTTFLPPFITWYAAMLFAIVPLRNILPGSPPPGSWIDQAVVLWVLIALAVAMTLFIYAWWRQRDRKTKT